MSKPDIKIIIACHKPCSPPQSDIYIPIHVGSSGNADIGFLRDDSGDNISDKNPLYSELTGLYFAWKNIQSDYLGLVHYRRLFTLKSRFFQKRHSITECCLSEGSARKLLSSHRVVVPVKRNYYIETIYSHYDHTLDGRHLKVTRQIIKEMSPEYLQSFDAVMNSTSAYMFNMYIMERELSDNYCEWLFKILFVLEKRLYKPDMSSFDARFIGRISEILFNVWIGKCISSGELDRKDIIEIPFIYAGKVSLVKKGASFLAAKFLHKKYTESF